MQSVLLQKGHAVGMHFHALGEHTGIFMAMTWVRQCSREIKDGMRDRGQS